MQALRGEGRAECGGLEGLGSGDWERAGALASRLLRGQSPRPLRGAKTLRQEATAGHCNERSSLITWLSFEVF
jgi:hypothetical protein